ncbi:glycoside hydrolase [candidate division KSB1 bacterium]|nr:glycoside hydrolase [candidate division KSB1 bacterium]
MRFITCTTIFSLLLATAYGRDIRRELNLENWKFEIGNSDSYAKTDYDDSDWEYIRVPGCWEDAGFPGYDGYAWYRTIVYIPEELKRKTLRLRLGRIDDVDRVYMNGVFIGGMGSMPPKYESAFNFQRDYYIPANFLKYDRENLIAIQVYDEHSCGGISGGDIGLYSENTVELVENLTGMWKFTTGNKPEYSEINFDDSDWQDMMVPAPWSSQGLGDYDGYAWYRKEITIDGSLKGERLILALGKIDDAEQVYFNGERIGGSVYGPLHQSVGRNNNFYNQESYYYIPSHLIRWGRSNTIAVQVWDAWNIGGIYEGPVGITTRKLYMEFKKIW